MVASMTAPAVTIERFKATEVDEALEAQLLELTLPTGDMAKVYRACKKDTVTWTGQVLVARIDGTVVGWALRWKHDGHWRRWCVHLFVHPDHRRCGVGSTLVEACRFRLRRDTVLRGFIWDDTSCAFWSTRTAEHVEAPDFRK